MPRKDYSRSIDLNQTAPVIEHKGHQYRTGLMVPAKRPVTFSPLESKVRPLTPTQISDWIRDPRRAPSVEMFPADKFIKSQGERGSCAGYAGAKSLEKSQVLLGMPHNPLSGEGLYAQVNGDKDQGAMLDDCMEAMTDNGVPSERLVPHETYLAKDISGEAWADCANNQSRECYRIDTEIGMASALVSNFMVVVAVHAGRNFMRLDRNGVLGSDSGNGNHAVHLDDLRIAGGRLEYRLVNSWGLEWGDDGAGWTNFKDHFARTIKIHCFYAIRSVKRR